MHLPAVVSDLALILATASALCILCRIVRLPTILGLIAAGFILGPLVPFVKLSDPETFSEWSELGIIMMLFSLGLEFNVSDLRRVGRSVGMTALFLIPGTLLIGALCGSVMGWGRMDCLIFGGMLVMNAATVVIKALEEHGLHRSDVARTVSCTLLAEDLAGVVLMTLLEHLAMPGGSSAAAFLGDIALQFLWLALWLLLGIRLVPRLFRYVERHLNDELTLLLSLGVCFAMVLLSHELGFSALLGAFLAGVFFAETLRSEHIAHLAHGITELFGAIVHISVGYMLSPEILRKDLVPILVIGAVILCAKFALAALGLHFARYDARDAVLGGCALSQVGEVAFIIAAFGRSLGVLREEVYSVTVGISVLTTLATPLLLGQVGRIADRAPAFLKRDRSAKR